MLFFWTLYLSKNPEKNASQFSQKYEAAQLFSTLIIKSPLFEKINKCLVVIVIYFLKYFLNC